MLVILMGGVECPKLRNAPEEHMAPNVPVVTTSTSSAAFSAPFFLTRSMTSSAVQTTAFPDLILSLISS